MLRNTLVCDSIDVATELGYNSQRHRCVTKDGLVIENSGAMSGGGKPRRGGMGSSLKQHGKGYALIADTVEEFERRIERLDEEIDELQTENYRFELEIKTFENESGDIKLETSRLN